MRALLTLTFLGMAGWSSVSSATPYCQAGTTIEMIFVGDYYPVTVVGGPDSMGQCKVRQDGADMWITRERLRPLGGGEFQASARNSPPNMPAERLRVPGPAAPPPAAPAAMPQPAQVQGNTPSFRVGERIEYLRNGRREVGTVTESSRLGLTVLQDGSGLPFSFTTDQRYQIRRLGPGAKTNPLHVSTPRRAGQKCPTRLAPRKNEIPSDALVRQLITCYFEDTSVGTYAGQTVNVDFSEFKIGSRFQYKVQVGSVMPLDLGDTITPVTVTYQLRKYSSMDVTTTDGARQVFYVYVDNNRRWATGVAQWLSQGTIRITPPAP